MNTARSVMLHRLVRAVAAASFACAPMLSAAQDYPHKPVRLLVGFAPGGDSVVDVIAGRIDFLFGALTVAGPQIQAGKLRPLAVTSSGRSASLPNVPAASQTIPKFEASSFSGVGAPAGLPRALIERLNRELRRVSELADIKQRFDESGGEARWSSAEDFRKMVESEIDQWKRVVEARKIEIN